MINETKTRKTKVLAALLLATLTLTLLTALQPTPTIPPLLPPQNTPAQPTTQKQPTTNNLTYTYMQIRLSAIDNLTGISCYSHFNESFYDVLPTEISNLTLASVAVYSNVIDVFNATTPEPYEPVMPFHSITLSSPELMEAIFSTGAVDLALGGSGASIYLAFNDTSSAAENLCNTTLNLVIQQLTDKLSSKGMQVELLLTKILVVENLPVPTDMSLTPKAFINATCGIAFLTTQNTSLEVYNLLEGDLPDGTYEKAIAQSAQSSTHKGITIGDISFNSQNASHIQINTVLRGDIMERGQNYAFSTRKMLNLPSGTNITVTPGQSLFVVIYTPTNANITETYPSDYPQYMPGAFSVGLPYYSYQLPGQVYSLEDINCTYGLLPESDIPYLAVIDYKMVNGTGQIDWNPDPGETVNLMLTIKNVGQAKASAIQLSGYISPSVANFIETSNPWISKVVGDLDAGESITLDFDIIAISSGLASISFSFFYQGQPSLALVCLPLGVSYSGPILVPYAAWSDYIVSPGDEVNLLLTFKNFGADAGDTNASIMPLGFVTDINMSATFRNLGNAMLAMDEVILDLGSLAYNESVTAKITMISDSFYYTQTGSTYSFIPILLNASQLGGIIIGPLVLPGVRPDSSLFLEVKRTPEIIEGSPGDEVTVTVRLRNLGTMAVEVTVEQLLPEGCELAEGETNATVTVMAGEEFVLTFRVRISGAGGVSGSWIAKANGFRAPVPLPTVKVYRNMTYKWGYLGLKDTPQGYCSAVQVRLPSGSSLSISLSGEAVVSAEELSGNPVDAPVGILLLDWFLSVTVSNPEVFENMTLRVYYDEAAVNNAGLDEAALRIYFWNGSQWVEVPSTVDTVNNIITANIDHLSYFSMGAPLGEVPTTNLLLLLISLARAYYDSLSTRNLYIVGGVILVLAAVAIATILYRRRIY